MTDFYEYEAKKKFEKKIQNGRQKKTEIFKTANSQKKFLKRSIFQTFWKLDCWPDFLFFE